jgi:hypothetical protein
MTDYERGFNAGEQDSWKGRGHPLPKPPANIADERMRGYWDGRLPRNPLWARQRRLAPAKWDAERERYMVGTKEAA